MMKNISRLFLILLIVNLSLFSLSAEAYQLKAGDFLLKPFTGAKVNFLHFDPATRESSAGGMVLGLETEYALSAEWSISGVLFPAVWPNVLEGNAGLGLKYRFNEWNAPLLPYLGGDLLFNINAPLRTIQELHWGPGVRFKCGMDYFVSKNFAVNVELSLATRLQIQPEIWPEADAMATFGVIYRL